MLKIIVFLLCWSHTSLWAAPPGEVAYTSGLCPCRHRSPPIVTFHPLQFERGQYFFDLSSPGDEEEKRLIIPGGPPSYLWRALGTLFCCRRFKPDLQISRNYSGTYVTLFGNTQRFSSGKDLSEAILVLAGREAYWEKE